RSIELRESRDSAGPRHDRRLRCARRCLRLHEAPLPRSRSSEHASVLARLLQRAPVMMTRHPNARRLRRLLGATVAVLLAACFEPGTRWEGQPTKPPVAIPICKVGDVRCGVGLEECQAGPTGALWKITDDCQARGLV